MQIPFRSMMEGMACTSAILVLGFLPVGCVGTSRASTVEQVPPPSSIEVPRPGEFPAADKILQGFDPRTKTAPWRQGDQILYGLSLRSGDTAQRWLLLLTVQSDLPVDRGSYEATLKGQKGDRHQLSIWTEVMGVGIRIFDGESGKELGHSQVQLPGTLLGRGILDAVEAEWALDQQFAKDGLEYAYNPAYWTRVLGAAKAMSSIVRVVQNDPLLADYLVQVIRMPGIFSVLTGLGVEVAIHHQFRRSVPASQMPSHLSSERQGAIVPMVIKVNGSAALLLEFLALDSGRPYALCGGLVALQARHPTRSDVHLGAVLLAARLGPQRPRITKRG